MFDGTPVSSDSPLNIAVILSAGYRWPRDNGLSFREYPAVCHCAPRDFAELDGLLCLHSVADKASAEAIVRNVLSASYGSQWSANRLTSLLNGYSSLQSWLLESFFQEHCRLFLDVPFIWHIWDGQIDGFHAFVNYHKLAAPNGQGRKTLERLTYTLLNDWILRQRSEVERKVDGAETRLAAAIHLQSELKKILEGEPPYDIFARWKPLHEQPIGWEPDINDGVRINIRPFLNAKPYRGSRNSCILRIMPKIKHGKDRGKEPWRPKGDYPWFWSWDERTPDFNGGDTFDGARWNDLHYSNEIKRKARAKKAEADASKS